jgi:hypothetical protein
MRFSVEHSAAANIAVKAFRETASEMTIVIHEL